MAASRSVPTRLLPLGFVQTWSLTLQCGGDSLLAHRLGRPHWCGVVPHMLVQRHQVSVGIGRVFLIFEVGYNQ